MSHEHVTINHAAEASAVAEIVRRSIEPRVVKVDDGTGAREILLTPPGMTPTSARSLLAEYRTAPERRKGLATLTDLGSFIEHTKRFSDSDSAVFVDRSSDAPKLLAVIDYHRAGAEGAPRFGQHRGLYAFPLSDEWKAWTSQGGAPMSQEEFARFLEDHLADVAEPSTAGETAKDFVARLSCGFATPVALLGLSRGLEIRVGQRIKQATKLESGESSFAFEEHHTDGAGAPLKVPAAFLLVLPVFRNGAPYQIATRLRYRVNGGAVSWSFEMHRVQAILDHAIREATERVAKETGLPVFEGTPE